MTGVKEFGLGVMPSVKVVTTKVRDTGTTAGRANTTDNAHPYTTSFASQTFKRTPKTLSYTVKSEDQATEKEKDGTGDVGRGWGWGW